MDLLDESGHRGLIRYIQRPGLQTARPQRIESLTITADPEHLITASVQPVGGGLADPARRARDQRNLLRCHPIGSLGNGTSQSTQQGVTG